MVKFYRSLSICAVLFLSVSFTQLNTAAAEGTQVEKLLTVLPDDVLGFGVTSGGDSLKPAFQKAILGRIWYDQGVQSFYQSISKELLTKIEQQMQDPNDLKAFNAVTDLIKLAGKRPVIIGAARKEMKDEYPVYGFIILDAGKRKTEIAAALAKVEALADEGEIVEVNIGSVKMHGPKDDDGVPGYWGWVGNYLVFAINDGEGLAIKYLSKPHTAVPGYLEKVPGTDDAIAVYIDCQKIAGVANAITEQQGDANQLNPVAAAIKELGLTNVKTFTARVGFAGPDVVGSELLEVPQQRTGLLANFRTINPALLDMVDAGAVNAVAIDCDIAGMYDTIMRTMKAALPNDDYTELQQAIAEFESQVQFNIRKGLLESLAGPVVSYSLPAGVMMEAPGGGVVVIAKLKDAPLLEKTMAALGNFAAAKSDGMLQVSSQVQSDGRTLHCWAIAPLAMMQILPCWTVVDDYVVIASNTALSNVAVKQIVSASAGTNSIRTTEGYKKVTAKLPDNLISLKYTDSKVQFNQMMVKAQQFWPMITMGAAAQQGINLPVMLPSAADVVKDMGPSCTYSWFDGQGLRSHSRGPGIEISMGTVAGASLGVGIMMPALAKTRQVAQRMVSGTNLSSIGKALLVYASDYEGKYPETLQELVEKADLSPKSLESPRKPKDFNGPSYIYITGQSATSPPDNILVYENPEFCPEMVNVLFNDCRVEAMKPAEFLQKLKATYKRLGRKMPEVKFEIFTKPGPAEKTFQSVPMPVEK